MKEQEKFEDIETIAQYGTKSLEQMERHAAVSAGFHDYEQDSFADKQMIANLCTQYKVFFEDDPKFSKFLDEMNAYAELDPYEHNNYLKEMNYVTNLSSKIEEMHRLLDEQEKEFLVSEDNSDIEAYNKLSEQDKMKADREYVLKEETIDNRRRALLSFEAYFENIRRGNLKDMDGLSDDANDKIKEANKISGRTLIDFEDEQGRKCYYINSSGGVVVRKPADYVPEMMRMAGGEYIFSNSDLGTDDNALSTMTIQPETFYEKAWDADVLIYNSDIAGSVESISELMEKYPLLSDFTAVKNGDIWCTEKNMFQQTTGAADMIAELHLIFTGEADNKMNFMYRLE